RGAEDAELGDAVAGPVADDGLVSRLAEVERLVGAGGRSGAGQVEVPNAVAEVADLTASSAQPVAGDSSDARRAEVQEGLARGGVERAAAVRVQRPGAVTGTIGA